MQQKFLIFFVGFLGGISIRSFLNIELSFVVLIFFLGTIVFLFSVLLKEFRNKFIIGISVFIFAFGFGVVRFDIAQSLEGGIVLDAQVEQKIFLTGTVSEEADIRETHTKLTVKIESLGENILNKKEKSKALLIVSHYPEFFYGDKIKISGTLTKPQNFTGDEDGRTFDYISFLAKDGIYYQMFYPSIELIESGGGNVLKRNLLALKGRLLENVSRVIPEPHASLLGGIVFGAKQSLGERLLDSFRATGIIHIVVLSGYNITIIAEAIGRVASFAPRMIALSLSILSIIGFAVMVGAGATVIRASIMALLVLLARATGRIYEITRALLVAGFAMVFYNPYILIFDPSFQLSFLATIGLIYLAPNIQKFFIFIPTKFQLREFAVATIATQLFVLPLIIYMTGEFSLVSLPVNLAILVFVPFIMLFGFLAALFGFIHIFLSLPVAFLAFILLEYVLRVVSFFDFLPITSVSIPQFSFLFVIIFYAFYGAFFYFLYKSQQKIKN